MAKYKFPQFNVEITDPVIEINLNTIQDQAINKLLSVSVILATDTAQFGVTASDMPYIDTWDDDDITVMVDNWLKQYES